MRSAVIIFPGSNRDRDMIDALTMLTGHKPATVWHADDHIPDVDLIVLPGGFTYGDYLRAGAIAARAPVMAAVTRHAADGVMVMGICNGFQILCEAGLLPGVLMRNESRRFICRQTLLRVETVASPFTSRYQPGQIIGCPVAHGEGNYRCDDATLQRLEDDDRIAFRYADAAGEAASLNGSVASIAGILNAGRNVLGMMPHPENLIEDLHGGTDGREMFLSTVDASLKVIA
jgi:phosphoribosylformylglycinamidine synthase I